VQQYGQVIDVFMYWLMFAFDVVNPIYELLEDKPIDGLATLSDELYVHFQGIKRIAVYDTERPAINVIVFTSRTGKTKRYTESKTVRVDGRLMTNQQVCRLIPLVMC
jgi:hypothetical protein